ncbi:MAG: DUF4274 domain-containing protein [Polyangiaceae bacterium]
MSSPDALDPVGRARLEAVFEDALEQPEIVRTLESAEELHAFADAFNWDDASVRALVEVIRHPLCDAGTAKLIYWRADPDDLFVEYASRDDVDSEVRREHWDLLIEIEDRLAEEAFATSRIPFEPPYERAEGKAQGRPIPAALFEPTR